MKLKNKILVLSLFLVLICCIGAVSATEDIENSNDTLKKIINNIGSDDDE